MDQRRLKPLNSVLTRSKFILAAPQHCFLQEHYVGKVIFVELVTPDLAAAKKFYAGLFGWSFSDSRPGTTGFAEASLDGRPVAALVQKKMRGDEKKQPAWLTFIAVRDVDAAQKTALLHGARSVSYTHLTL